MARLLLNLRHVPDDEADEIRALLEQHGIEYFETPPSRWGISLGGIWLQQDADLDHVRALLARYQAGRLQRARAELAEARRTGRVATFIGQLRREPLRVLLLLAAAALVLYLTLAPFLTFG